MLKFAIRRLAQSVLVFYVFLTLTFILLWAQPGDVTNQFILDPNITPEGRAELREQFGVNRPFFEQYFTYVGNFFQGDFGNSFRQGSRPVLDVIFERLPRTVLLFVTAGVLAFYLGFVVGKIIAWRRNGFIEYTSTIGGVYLFTFFTPWLALLILWLFGFLLDWFPLAKFITPTTWIRSGFDATTIFGYMVLTAIAISVIGFIALLALRRWRVRRGGTILLATMFGLTGLAILFWFVGGAGRFALDIISHMVLPILTLTLLSFAGTMLLTRNSMLETIREDYVMVARAKGLPVKTIRNKYVSRNAILPVVTSLVLTLALSIDGGVITEGIFSWEGLGLTLVDSATNGDIPLAMAAVLFVGLFALIAHVLIDILYVFLDPRLRL